MTMLLLRSLAILTFAAGAAVAAEQQDLIGIPTIVFTRAADTLLDIAKDHDVGYVAIRAANPGIDPWMTGEDQKLRVPTQHIIPDAPRRGIVINLAELRIYYFPPKGEPRSFPIGIGGEGKETPVGRTRVVAKRANPVWVPTKSEHAEDPDLPATIGPGPDNPMGDYALYLGRRGYAIHGTNKTYSIGRRDSHGCIRLYPEDIEWLFHEIRIGTLVTVVDQQAKVGWSAGELYLEVNPTQQDADHIEAEGAPEAKIAADADGLIVKAAGSEAGRLDWYAIHLAETRPDGVPVQITRPLKD